LNEAKKVIEARVLAAARKVGIPMPAGEIPSEQPDFRFETEAGALGVEVSELLRPPSSDGGIMPVAAAAYHRQVVQMAQGRYYRGADVKPARVNVYFADRGGARRDKRELARVLAESVRANVHKANPVANLGRRELPEGLASMSIASGLGKWSCGESGVVTVSDIRDALARSIGEKDRLVPAYRENLGPGARVWLLLYTTVDVARGMPVPCRIQEWRFRFGFDRVFWLDCLENRFVEIRRP
jgi:hypothetical protein